MGTRPTSRPGRRGARGAVGVRRGRGGCGERRRGAGRADIPALMDIPTEDHTPAQNRLVDNPLRNTGFRFGAPIVTSEEREAEEREAAARERAEERRQQELLRRANFMEINTNWATISLPAAEVLRSRNPTLAVAASGAALQDNESMTIEGNPQILRRIVNIFEDAVIRRAGAGDAANNVAQPVAVDPVPAIPAQPAGQPQPNDEDDDENIVIEEIVVLENPPADAVAVPGELNPPPPSPPANNDDSRGEPEKKS